MYLMFGDEADREAVLGKKFFVYGAIFAPTNSLLALHNAIEQLRIKNNMANTDCLKSASGSRPESMPFEVHRDLKAEVMKTAREVGNVKFCAQVTLHDLARNQTMISCCGARTPSLASSTSSSGSRRRMAYAVLDKIPVEHPYRYQRRLKCNAFEPFSRIVVSPGSEIWLSSRQQLIQCCMDTTC